MKYPRSPYYENAHRRNNVWEPSEDLIALKEAIKKEKEIFEIGFNLGERLSFMNASGGVEFDPMFGTYGNNYFQIYKKFIIYLSEINEWFKQSRKIFYTYHWLEMFNDEDRKILLEKIKANCTGKIYFLENFDIEDTKKIGDIQVYDCSNRRKLDDSSKSKENDEPATINDTLNNEPSESEPISRVDQSQ